MSIQEGRNKNQQRSDGQKPNINSTKARIEFPIVRTPVLQNAMNKTKGFSIPSVDNERDLVQLQSYLNSENISHHVRNRSLPSKVQANGPTQPNYLDPLQTLN